MPLDGPICPYCQCRAVLCDASAIYGPKLAGQFNLWVCRNYWDDPTCDAFVGVHANSLNSAPIGTLANPELRDLRHKVRQEYTARYPDHRKAAEARKLLLGREKQIGFMDADECRRALVALTYRETSQVAG